MPKYIIESTQAQQYWNEHGPVRGWLTSREDATEFTQEQRDAGGLPNRGCWVIVNEPDSQRRIPDMSKQKSSWEWIHGTLRNPEGHVVLTINTIIGLKAQDAESILTALNAHSALVGVKAKHDEAAKTNGHSRCGCDYCEVLNANESTEQKS